MCQVLNASINRVSARCEQRPAGQAMKLVFTYLVHKYVFPELVSLLILLFNILLSDKNTFS